MAYRNRSLSALFWLLASLSILLSGVSIWAHQTLLTADGWSGLVGEVASDPEVIEGASTVLVGRVADALDVEDRVAEVVPAPLDIVTTTITAKVEEQIAAIVADFAATDAFQDAFVAVNKTAHDAAMTAIRGGDSEALTSQTGMITLNVFPLVEGVLQSLQDAGLIDAASNHPGPERVRAIGRPRGQAGGGTRAAACPMTSAPSRWSTRRTSALVQEVVRWFDVITVVLLLLAVICVALALWLSRADASAWSLWLAVWVPSPRS